MAYKAKSDEVFKQFGKYTILKKIALGGMAEIFLSTDLDPTGQNTGRFVVIKRALSQYSENKEFKAMFQIEGKVACSLKHRNIVPIYEFGFEEDQFFLCLEYISGNNLRNLVKKLKKIKKNIPIPHALYIIKEVASGLDYAHNAIDSHTGQPLHLIHRDVSPQNIMLSFDGEVKLIDFGIAKINTATSHTRAGHLKGKFSYMSPEQARGEKLDYKTDIFCIGIILWEALANERLFESKEEIGALKKIKACNIPNIQKINPKVPKQLANIVNKALSKSKTSRYQSAAELEKDLNIFLNVTYPQFSQYDFISFMKEVFSKEILKEREMLKSYSNKVKSYLSKSSAAAAETIELENYDNKSLSMNLIETSQTNVSQANLSQTEKQATSTKTQTASKTNVPVTEATRSQTIKTASKSLELHPEEESPTISVAMDNPSEDEEEGIISKPLEQLQQYSQTKTQKSASITSTSTSTSTSATTISNGSNFKFLLNISSLFIAFGLIGATVWTIKNIDLVSNSSLTHKLRNELEKKMSKEEEKEKIVSERSISNELPAAPKEPDKIFINTQPSGAKIFINDQFMDHSPSLVSLPSKSNFLVTIKKDGYKTRVFKKIEGHSIPNKIHIQLDKQPQSQRKRRIRFL